MKAYVHLKYVVLIGSLFLSIFSFAQNMYVEVINVSRSLNVRQAPDQNAKIIGSIKLGTLIEVKSISNGWAEIVFNDKQAYVSANYVKFVQIAPPENIVEETETSLPEVDSTIVVTEHKENINKSENKFEKIGIDFLPSTYVGISGFLGDYTPKPSCGFGIDAIFQFYMKNNNLPQGWLGESSIGYSLKGGGGMLVHYFTLLVSPLGYIHTFESNSISLFAIAGMSFNFGGGHLRAYYNGVGKTYNAVPFDFGIQIKLGLEKRKCGFAISYDQGCINVIKNSSLALKNYGVNVHFYYRLWDVSKNTIYKK